jgi:GH24 family phage-related lysozyme (muramidase)
MTRTRVAVWLLAMSATAFVARLTHEGYTDGAIIPTKGDVPTVGFGSTVREDGTRVSMADRTDPVTALRVALTHIQRDEAKIKQCIGPNVLLHPAEFDVYSELAYNIGTPTFCTNRKTGGPGAIPRALQARDYVGACKAILLYKYAGGYDCSTPGNRRCSGVWKDRLRMHNTCMEAQR